MADKSIPSTEGSSFTNTIHSELYSAISPLQPGLSQAGKTGMITGGGTGIGFAIARAFAQASAATIIILSRREEVVIKAASKLSAEFVASNLKVLALRCDVGNGTEVEAVWAGLARDGVFVDILVLNAAVAAAAATILDIGTELV